MTRTSPRSGISALLRPRSVAIIGASDDPASLGGAPLANLAAFDSEVSIGLVSRRLTRIGGQQCVATVTELRETADCAVLLVPARGAAAALAECGERGIRAAIVCASGFSETGPQGRTAQRQLAEVATRYGMAVAGPNCLGLVNFVDRIPLTFAAVRPTDVPDTGGVALLAQSGAMTMALTYAAQAAHVPISYAISTGNEAVLTLEDYLAFLLDDEHTRCVTMLAEQIRRPELFLQLARRARQLAKPLVLLHIGRSGEAALAAASHTGALARDYSVIETVLRREGVVLVESIDEQIDATSILARRGMPRRGGTALVTDSGSVKTMSLDLAGPTGALFPQLTQEARQHLTGSLPEFASIGNPVDITAQGLSEPALYGEALQALRREPEIGVTIMATMPGSDQQTTDQVGALLPAIEQSEASVVHVFMGGDHPVPAAQDLRLRQAGVPVFRSLERTLRAVGRIQGAVRAVDRAHRAPARAASVPARDDATSAPRTRTARLLHPNELSAKALLAEYGLRSPNSRLVPSGGVVEAARDIGYPVALKAIAASLVHKTEAGAVATNLADEDSLRRALHAMRQQLARRNDVEGYLVEAMAGDGIEMIVGARRDPHWGVAIVVGVGGVFAEALADVALLASDPTDAEIRNALDTLRGGALLRGFRSGKPVNLDELVAAVHASAELMSEHPYIVEFDVNPLMVSSDGVLVLDAVIITDGDPT